LHTQKLLALVLIFMISPVIPQEMRPVLTYQSAKKIVDKCVEYADERSWRISIAVHDGSNDLLAFARMDGAAIGTHKTALWKADATAAFPIDTKIDADAVVEFPALAAAPHVAIFEGGLAVFTVSGVHIGGVGVSGARGSEDAECAKAGITAAGLVVRDYNDEQD
jgi:glc operon protein GlcG